MSFNTFGKLFRFTTWGESHGPAIGCIIDGCPPLITLKEEDIQKELNKRKPGQSKFTTQRKESDKVEILSGVFEGKTTGTPISLIIYNEDMRSKDYGNIKDKFRPGHADYTYFKKYGIRDYRVHAFLEARNVTVYLTAFTEGKMEPEDTLDEAYELEEVETEGQETDSDSSPDTEEVQEKQTKPVFDEQQQQVFDKAIADKVYKLREKEREAEELKQRLQSLEQRMPKQERPSVPKEPDPYALSDQEYQQQLRMRDEAIARQAAFDAQQRFQQQEAERLQQERLMREQEALNEKVATYSQRAVQLGISNEELQAAGNAVASFGIADDVVNYILEDDLGPAITKYLSQNVTELDTIRAMSPAQAAVRIATHVREKAAALKPKVNAAPDPVEQPAKAGVAPKARGPKGAIFE